MSTPQISLPTDDVSDLATSNTSCRVLVVSPSLLQATALISRIQALGNTSSSTTETVNDNSIMGGTGKKDLLSPALVKIPWTIRNRYYSADVHFAAHPMHGLAPYLLQNVPAVLFVWAHGEAYRHHIERLSQDLGGHEPEVLLAVQVKSEEPPAEPVSEEEGEEDNAAIDGFLSSFGFEYVDAKEDVVGSGKERQYTDDGDDGIPGLPRVVDALSTIMWPSMRARERDAKQGEARDQRQRDPSLFEWGTQGNSLSLADDLVANSSSQLSARARRLRSETEELTKWLVDAGNVGDREDPWRLGASSDIFVSSPLGEFLGPFTSASSHDKQGSSDPSSSMALAKFDDDFTAFVSAPVIAEGESGRSTPLEDEAEDKDKLKPSGGMRAYNSLGSVSDFGGDSEGDKGAVNVISDDEDDGDLPTQEEILETSSKLFGKPIRPSSARQTEGSQATQDAVRDGGIGRSEQGSGEFGRTPFDLSRVLGTLQQMKEEIAGMENEDERRKAAARVALGLVYGLEAEGDMD